MIWGKVLGGLLGGLLLHNLIGVLLGVFIGHQFDRGLGNALRQGGLDGFAGLGGLGSRSRGPGADDATGRFGQRADPRLISKAFFRTTISVMGHLAKADGHVSEDEIRAARGVMHHMQLSPEQVKQAIRFFTEGKREEFPLEEHIRRFRQACFGRRDLFRAFVEIQMQAAMAGGGISNAEREILWRICRVLGVSRVQLAQIEALLRAHQAFNAGGQQPRNTRNDLDSAYQVLGVESAAADKAVKLAYRRLMNQHHPDKLVAKGLPEEMMETARVKTREIRAAYDTIRDHRGFK